MVKDVIMDQGGGVDHLRDDGDHALALLGPPHHPGVCVKSVPYAHRDHWPQSLPSPVKVVLGHLTQLCVHLEKLILKLEYLESFHLQLPAQLGMDLVHHGVEVAAHQDEGVVGRLTKVTQVMVTSSRWVAGGSWARRGPVLWTAGQSTRF